MLSVTRPVAGRDKTRRRSFHSLETAKERLSGRGIHHAENRGRPDSGPRHAKRGTSETRLDSGGTPHTENRFRACMGMLHKADALNHADRLERPIPGDEEQREQGDVIPDEKAEAALFAVDGRQEREHFHNVLEQALGELSVVQSAVLRHRFTQRHTRMETALALHITPQEVRREEARALQLLRGKPAVLCLRDEILETAAYHGTGWFAWYFDRGSVEERIIEQASKNKEE